jgi:uncharacterized phage protein (TIGR01671 family)
MREILFRGKRIDNGEWVYGGFTLDAASHPRIIAQNGCGLLFPVLFPKVILETVGQYTGIECKSGVKIFEGDIARIITWRSESGIEIKKFRVCFENGSFIMESPDISRYELASLDIEEFDILGNIHDNPELLAGNKPNDEEDEEEEDNAAE